MQKNKLQISVIVSYLSAVISMAVSLLYTPFTLRILGQSEYGVYQLVCSVASYLSLLSFGFNSSYIRFYSRYNGADRDQKISSLNGMFMLVFGCLSVFCLIVGFCLINNLDVLFKNLSAYEIRTSKILLFFLAINVAMTFINSVYDSYIVAHEKFIFQKLIYMLKTVLNPILTIPFLLLGFKSVTLTIVTTLLTLINLIVNHCYCKRKLGMKITFGRINYRLLKEITIFSSFIFLNIVTDQINWNLDKFLLGIYRNSIEIAVYGVSSQLNSYYMSCSTIISSVFIPRVNRIAASKDNMDSLNELFIKIGRIQFMVLAFICSGFIFFGKAFIEIWAGDRYEQSYLPAVFLMMSATAPLIQNIGIEIQKAKNVHKFRSIIYTLIAVANLILSIILTPKYGVMGCTLGTCSALILGNGLIMNIYYSRKMHLNIKLFWKNILSLLLAMFIPFTFGVAYELFIRDNNLLVYIVCLVIYAVIYCVSIYNFGMIDSEKQMIKTPIQKILKKTRGERSL